MKHSNFLSLLAVPALILLGSFATASATSSSGVTLVSQEAAIANDLVTNSDQGRPYMVLDPVIEAVARARAKDMAERNYFDHVNPDGVAANYLLRQAGYQLPSSWSTDPTLNYVESIAAGYSDPGDTWTAWMNSAPHKQHLLAQIPFFATETHYGVGYYYDPNSTYKYYWVVITAPPQPIAITTPARGADITNASISVAGTADASDGATRVQFRIENTTGTSAYQAASGIASWSGTIAGLAGGHNIIRAQALDSSGNVVAENTSGFTYVVQGALDVTVSGSGSVTAAYAGQTSEPVGELLTIKATPASGCIFTGWTGSITSSKPVLTFTMQDQTDLQANFEPNPFGPVVGSFYGNLTAGSAAQSGLVRVTVSPSGLFTGRLYVSGSSWSFSGALNAQGSSTITIPNGKDPWTLNLQADLTGGSGQITGSATDNSGTYGFTVTQSSFNSTSNPAPQAGRYTMVLAPNASTTGTSVPQGNGYAAIVVNTSGAATISGRLADGTAYSTTGHVSNNGTLALYFVPSGAPRGASVNGLITFESTDVSDVDGSFTWVKPARPSDPYYPAGFATQLPAVGSLYVRPVTGGLQAMAATSGAATVGLGDGNLTQPLDVPVVVSQTNKATMLTPGSPDVNLAISPISGAVIGSFILPDGNVSRSVRGIIIQKQRAAYGYFRGITQYGYFAMQPGA